MSEHPTQVERLQAERVKTQLQRVELAFWKAKERWATLPPSLALRQMDAATRLLGGQLQRGKRQRKGAKQ